MQSFSIFPTRITVSYIGLAVSHCKFERKIANLLEICHLVIPVVSYFLTFVHVAELAGHFRIKSASLFLRERWASSISIPPCRQPHHLLYSYQVGPFYNTRISPSFSSSQNCVLVSAYLFFSKKNKKNSIASPSD